MVACHTFVDVMGMPLRGSYGTFLEESDRNIHMSASKILCDALPETVDPVR